MPPSLQTSALSREFANQVHLSVSSVCPKFLACLNMGLRQIRLEIHILGRDIPLDLGTADTISNAAELSLGLLDLLLHFPFQSAQRQCR